MKTFFTFLLTVIIVGVLGYTGFIACDYLKEKRSLQFEPLPSPIADVATTTDSALASSTDLVADLIMDTSSWKTYSDGEMGYSIKYPGDIIINRGIGLTIFAFPKDAYFHWPLLDDARLTISASSTCGIISSQFVGLLATSSMIRIGNNAFIKTEERDAATGTRVHKIAFDMKANNVCYRALLYNRGTNGAGFHVSDPVLVKKYDDQHDVDIQKVTDTIYAMLGSLEILKTPEGILETEQ